MVAYYLTLAAVVALAAAKGGRFERQMALVMLVASVSSLATQLLFGQFVPILPLTCIDFVVALAFFRLWRHGAWIGGALLLQAASLLVDFAYAAHIGMRPLTYLTLLNAFSYAILGTIAFSVIRRRIGPPVRPPNAQRTSEVRAPLRPSIIYEWLYKR